LPSELVADAGVGLDRGRRDHIWLGGEKRREIVESVSGMPQQSMALDGSYQYNLPEFERSVGGRFMSEHTAEPPFAIRRLLMPMLSAIVTWCLVRTTLHHALPEPFPELLLHPVVEPVIETIVPLGYAVLSYRLRWLLSVLTVGAIFATIAWLTMAHLPGAFILYGLLGGLTWGVALLTMMGLADAFEGLAGTETGEESGMLGELPRMFSDEDLRRMSIALILIYILSSSLGTYLVYVFMKYALHRAGMRPVWIAAILSFAALVVSFVRGSGVFHGEPEE
jgi:hypothetical protein